MCSGLLLKMCLDVRVIAYQTESSTVASIINLGNATLHLRLPRFKCMYIFY